MKNKLKALRKSLETEIELWRANKITGHLKAIGFVNNSFSLADDIIYLEYQKQLKINKYKAELWLMFFIDLLIITQ